MSTSHPELIAWFIQVGKLENSLNSSECGCGSTFNVIADSLVMHGTGEETDDSTLLFSMARPRTLWRATDCGSIKTHIEGV